MALVQPQIVSEFQAQFSSTDSPSIFRAPGRVNLIGEHTDYNLGFVFPIALEMSCYVAVAPAKHGDLRIYSRNLQQQFSLPAATAGAAARSGEWHDYVIGVAQQLQWAGVPIASADLWIASEVPTGAGLSSSASLEVATALALLHIANRTMEPIEVARLAQRAETQFVGMPCGIMDQYASVFGREHSAIQIDCRSLTHQYVQLPSSVAIVAVNSLVKHELGTSAYRDRVQECRQAVEAISQLRPEVASLRDISLADFSALQDSVPLLPRRRARHVISDSQRVLDFGLAAQAGDLREMGRLFVASHRSMQYDYEISCEEIDFLVDTAVKLPGVYGARMTGGGFGGCTVNLVDPDAVQDFEQALTTAYGERYSLQPVFYKCIPAQGAGPV